MCKVKGLPSIQTQWFLVILLRVTNYPPIRPPDDFMRIIKWIFWQPLIAMIGHRYTYGRAENSRSLNISMLSFIPFDQILPMKNLPCQCGMNRRWLIDWKPRNGKETELELSWDEMAKQFKRLKGKSHAEGRKFALSIGGNAELNICKAKNT